VAGWLVVLKVLPALLAIGLVVYCLVECLQSPGRDVRTFRKPTWIVVILLLPVGGALAWLVAGRPHRARHSRPRGSAPPPTDPGPTRTYPIGPDDDPEFLERLRREQEQRRHPERPTEADD
jgi:phospholipase D-like protein